MNKLTIIGNLVRDPESRTTQSGKTVCNFTVAVNRRKAANGQPEADFFRVQAWDNLGINCQRYLAKGRKVCVMGPVEVETYTANDGTTRASMNVLAQDVEFLSAREEGKQTSVPNVPAPEPDLPNGFDACDAVDDNDLPF